jgi:hypothetical protein
VWVVPAGTATIGFAKVYAPSIVRYMARVWPGALTPSCVAHRVETLSSRHSQRSSLTGCEVSPLSSLWFPTVRPSLVCEAESNRHYLRVDKTGGCIVVA